MPAVEIAHDADPKEVILERVGDLEGVEIFGADVMVAIYERPNKTKSGIILTDTTTGEDLHQGKIGLIVKKGPLAWVDDDNVTFRDEDRCDVGDWVFFRPSDGWRATLNTMRGALSKDNLVNLRIVKDTAIRGRVSHPDFIY
jgi:co-chaperonin GroES (HSP10)